MKPSEIGFYVAIAFSKLILLNGITANIYL